MLQTLKDLAAAGLIRHLDHQFAAALQEAGEERQAVLLGAALVSQRLGQGHVCVDLRRSAGSLLFDTGKPGSELPALQAPALDHWRRELHASALVSDGVTPAPLVLDAQDRLYLGRYHGFETDLAECLLALSRSEQAAPDLDTLNSELDRLFPSAAQAPDHQRVAAALAALNPFCVISGGPGTGKTTTVTRILALLLRLQGPLRIALAAPTGKAAARLGETIRDKKPALDLASELADLIPDEVLTLHRLLGLRGSGHPPRHHRDKPLHCDLLVVDEASMIDLPMMARLLAALRPGARLILLGDKDQLASVEAGYVLGDICDSGHEHGFSRNQVERVNRLCNTALTPPPVEPPPLADSIALLRHSYRFAGGGGIGVLAAAVNGEKPREALACLQPGGHEELDWQRKVSAATLPALVHRAADQYADYLRADGPRQALEAFNRYRVLCALRDGPYGVKALNRAIEAALQRRGLLDARKPFYAGRPIMVTRNDYSLKLFNGDVGMVWPESAPAGAALRAWFQLPDGELKAHAVSRLPEYESVFAMTVHKSQGSEFQRILLLLPPEPSQVVTRELVYTGITRAIQQVQLAVTPEALTRAIETPSQRDSGLRERLWDSSAD